MPAATSLTFEPRRAVSRTSAPFRVAGILTRIPARLREVLAVKVLAPYQVSFRSVHLAVRVVAEHLALRRVRLGVRGRVERGRGGALPHDVGRDARPDHGRPVALAVADAVPVRVEPVAERPTGGMGQEAVLPPPARSVRRVEGVDEDVPAIRVE